MRKQLIIDTSFDNQPPIMQEAAIQPKTPEYCTRQDYILKIVSVFLLAAFYAGSLTINVWFNPLWAATSILHQIITFSCYAYVIMTTDLDEILNIKHSTNEKLVFCRFVSYCDWIIAFMEIAEGLLRCLDYFIKYGGLLNSYILYSSIAKFILYVYLLRNV